MNCKIFIDKQREEEVLIYAHEITPLIKEIEQMVNGSSLELIGYIEREAIPLEIKEVQCFISEGDKVYAITQKDKYLIKSRLYKIESYNLKEFVKINQSCIVNIKKIERFEAAVSGALKLKLKCGYSDYVSRRNLKAIKERFGIK